MTLKHPLVVAAFSALLGFGASVAYAWSQTPTDVAVIAAEVRALQDDVDQLTNAIENLNKRIDAIFLAGR